MDTPAGQQASLGEINPALESLFEELPSAGEWTQDEHDWWTRVFLRTLDKLYKIKES